MGPFESTERQGEVTPKYLWRNRNCKIVSDLDGSVICTAQPLLSMAEGASWQGAPHSER